MDCPVLYFLAEARDNDELEVALGSRNRQLSIANFFGSR